MKVFKFAFGGIPGAVAGYLIFIAFTELGLWYIFSNTIGEITTCLINFFVYKFWAFDKSDTEQIHKEISLYFLIAFAYWLWNSIFVFVFTNDIKIWYGAAKLIAIVILMYPSYSATKTLFKTRQH